MPWWVWVLSSPKMSRPIPQSLVIPLAHSINPSLPITMLNTPFAPWPSYTQEEADAVARVLLSNQVNYWTGTEGRVFVNVFAAYTACRYDISLIDYTVDIDHALFAS